MHVCSAYMYMYACIVQGDNERPCGLEPAVRGGGGRARGAMAFFFSCQVAKTDDEAVVWKKSRRRPPQRPPLGPHTVASAMIALGATTYEITPSEPPWYTHDQYTHAMAAALPKAHWERSIAVGMAAPSSTRPGVRPHARGFVGSSRLLGRAPP